MTEDTLRLITKVISLEASAAEKEELQRWTAASEVNQACFNDFVVLWEKTGEFRSSHNVEQGLQALKGRISFDKSRTDYEMPISCKMASLTLPQKIAASFILLACVITCLYLLKEPAPMQYKTMEMPFGKKGTLRLSDGSVLQVNSGTKISFPVKFDDDKRILKIDGEAFFEIAKDTNRPFVIESGNLVVQVLGTSFNLKSYKDDHTMELGVRTGSVSVTNKTKNNTKLANIIYLEPGELISINNLENTFEKKKANIDLIMSWTHEKLVFDHKNLYEVTQMLERWYNIPIHLKDETLKGCVFRGEFQNENLQNILEALKFSIGIEYQLTDKEVFISGKGCSTKT